MGVRRWVPSRANQFKGKLLLALPPPRLWRPNSVDYAFGGKKVGSLEGQNVHRKLALVVVGGVWWGGRRRPFFPKNLKRKGREREGRGPERPAVGEGGPGGRGDSACPPVRR